MSPTFSTYYCIRVQGTLDHSWETWFDGMTVSAESPPENETRIEGVVRDQAALHGMLSRIRDLNLVLIAVERRS